MKNILLCFVLIACTTISAFAQNRTVTGRVTSEDEPEGIPGVNVLVKGSMVGSITDIDGNYSVAVPDGSSTLVFSLLAI